MVNVYCRYPKKEYSSIILTINHNKQRVVVYPPNIRIPAKLWDKKRQRIKAGYPEYAPLNERLDIIRDVTVAEVNKRRALLQYWPNEELKGFILDQFDIEGKEKEESFTEFLKEWLKTRFESGKFSEQTLRKDKSHVKTLTEILDGVYGRCTWKHVGSDMFDKVQQTLFSRGFSSNYVGAILITLKKIMRNKAAREKIGPLDFMIDVSMPSSPVDSVYNTEEELRRMYALNLEFTPGLDRIRDQYLLAAWTGVAYSDLDRIADNIEVMEKDGEEYEVVVFRRTKSRMEQAIPLHETARKIIDKYQGMVPAVISNQKFNVGLKKVCLKAGINDVIIKTKYSGPQRIISKKEKWQLITTHTGRRSFATNALLAGIPMYAIMNITGHKTEDSFRKYIRMEGRISALRIAAHPFFRAG